MTTIENKTFDEERALYHLQDAVVNNVTFEGPADGESALKEGRNLTVSDCRFALRYPLWHVTDFTVTGGVLTETARAGLWYSRRGRLENVKLQGVKALRECDDIALFGCSAVSPEFGWQCRTLSLTDCSLTGEYAFFGSRNVTCDKLSFTGKYSFQYVDGLTIRNSTLDTKDAFWHAKNAVVSDSEIKGEYLGWYSENLTLIRCRISGTQPLCYCKGLKLIDCVMDNSDLAFEYSDVEADVKGGIVSVKNPRSGHITADAIGSVILGDAVYPCDCDIKTRD